MLIETRPLCEITGLTKAQFEILRRTTKPDLKIVRRNGPAGRNALEYEVSAVITWLNGLLPGGVTPAQQREIMDKALI